jgi:methylated-DNA-[protein]-cysteine S-methyltransferase
VTEPRTPVSANTTTPVADEAITTAPTDAETDADGGWDWDVADDAVGERLGAAEPPSADDLARLVDEAVRQAEIEALVDVAWTVADTPIGPLVVATTPSGLVKVAFEDEDAAVDSLAREVSPRVLRLPARLDQVRRELDEYFAGRRQVFEVALDWRLTRGFRLKTLHQLFDGVPFGHTVSYKDLAVRTGNPKASRAVGSAMATNPIPIVVPCHRVLRTGGDVGHYGGGVDAKVWLLRHEGALAL